MNPQVGCPLCRSGDGKRSAVKRKRRTSANTHILAKYSHDPSERSGVKNMHGGMKEVAEGVIVEIARSKVGKDAHRSAHAEREEGPDNTPGK
jgi:hypothetical protein